MSESTSRRNFLKTASAGAAAMTLTAAGRARAAGANDRINIGIIGCGSRGCGAHMPGVHRHAKEQNIEITAVCDPWRVPREKAAARVKEWYGREARQFVSYRDLLELDDIDAVMIASCDHQHTTHLEATAKAKKDVYCEKPLAMNLKRLKSACDAVKDNGVVAQIGTQLRSMPSMTGARELYRTGILGAVSRIEQCRNGAQPYWYSRIADVKEQDVDWQEFLMDARKRPFDPVQCSGWYGYRDFSDGPVPGLASHFIDLIHYITGAKFPTSVVCMGDTCTWKDKHNFTCPDHVQAMWTYPEGFLVSYSTNFGNGSANSFKILGERGEMDLLRWDAPTLTAQGTRKGQQGIKATGPVEPVDRPDHFLDWLQCMRTRKTCNASIDAGYQHAVAVIMAMEAYDTGRRMVYDSKKRVIRKG
ncbi:MAG: Gfo/Idh/MocA family oxidoreductase [bacterium]|nr:Gfo/Idh/MocA family oxidoreductase [bacterium]